MLWSPMMGTIEVYEVEGGWKFRLPNGYESYATFEDELMANHCGEKAFYRHQDNPEWIEQPRMAQSQIIIVGYGDLGDEIKPETPT